ncbi:MAG: RNA methyltransferase [Chitinophagales bacterium]|nr:RNA methyltransferase [Chitinophagales bacterium]
MLSKNEVKYIQSLCHKKQRQQERVFIAEGAKIIEELLASNYVVKKLFVTEKYLLQNRFTNAVITEVSTQEMDKISLMDNATDVLAIVEQKPNEMPAVKGKLNLVLDGIQDPGNFGTIIRIADWYGIENILCSNDTVDLYNNKVIQSTMGSFVRVNVWYGDLKTVFQKNLLPVFATVLNGKNLYEQNKITEGFLIIGNEGKGIREDTLSFVQHSLTIPKKGGAESLNAAVATGILLSWLTK